MRIRRTPAWIFAALVSLSVVVGFCRPASAVEQHTPHDSWMNVPSLGFAHDSWMRVALEQPEPERNAPLLVAAPVRVRVAPVDVEQWRPLVSVYFLPEDVELALLIISCESRGNHLADNPNSSASGLFQHVYGWWSGAWGITGPFDPFDPEQSIRAGAALAYGSGWQNWNPSRYCWG